MLVRMIFAELFAVLVSDSLLARIFGFERMIVSQTGGGKYIGLAAMVTLLTTISSMLTFSVVQIADSKIIFPCPIIFVIILAIVYVVSVAVTASIDSRKFRSIRLYMVMAVLNCMVIGGMLMGSEKLTGYKDFLKFGISTGLGFSSASVFVKTACEVFADGMRYTFRGCFAIAVYMGIISLALYSFVR